MLLRPLDRRGVLAMYQRCIDDAMTGQGPVSCNGLFSELEAELFAFAKYTGNHLLTEEGLDLAIVEGFEKRCRDLLAIQLASLKA